MMPIPLAFSCGVTTSNVCAKPSLWPVDDILDRRKGSGLGLGGRKLPLTKEKQATTNKVQTQRESRENLR